MAHHKFQSIYLNLKIDHGYLQIFLKELLILKEKILKQLFFQLNRIRESKDPLSSGVMQEDFVLRIKVKE
jgi:hypothetical protein